MGIRIKNIAAMVEEGGLFTTKVCDLYLEGGTIAAIDTPPEGFTAHKVIDGTGRMAIPGLINAHTHAYMTVFRNVADDLPFHEWLMGTIDPLEARLTPEDGYWGAMLGCMEMLRTGTTCFVDMHMFEGQSVRAAVDSGMRAVISRGLQGGESDPAGGARRIREALAEMELAKTLPHDGRLSFRLGPHAIYTCDNAHLKEIIALAKEKGLGINIHVSESHFEVDSCYAQHGCSPVELLDFLGLFDLPTLAAHCVHLSEGDIAILAKRGVHVVTNPISNMKLGNGFAPIPKLQKAGVNLCIGTDGAASNNTLNLFREMGVLTLIHKGLLEDAEAVSAQDALHFATVNGAKALGLNTGLIAPGKQADIAILNLDVPQFQPLNNPVSGLCYAAGGSEVETVIVDGRVVLENRQMLTIDQERVYFEVDRVRQKFGK